MPGVMPSESLDMTWTRKLRGATVRSRDSNDYIQAVG